MNYVYIKTEPGLWTVGFYDPDGKWQPESDHHSIKEAQEHASWLNGGQKPQKGFDCDVENLTEEEPFEGE